jgi:hypothetical protein
MAELIIVMNISQMECCKNEKRIEGVARLTVMR